MKKFTQFKKTINGTEYTAQFNGMSSRYKAIDEAGKFYGDNQGVSMLKMAEYLLKNVLVEPKKEIDDFEDADELNDVITFLSSVNNATFREAADGETETGKGKK